MPPFARSAQPRRFSSVSIPVLNQFKPAGTGFALDSGEVKLRWTRMYYDQSKGCDAVLTPEAREPDKQSHHHGVRGASHHASTDAEIDPDLVDNNASISSQAGIGIGPERGARSGNGRPTCHCFPHSVRAHEPKSQHSKTFQTKKKSPKPKTHRLGIQEKRCVPGQGSPLSIDGSILNRQPQGAGFPSTLVAPDRAHLDRGGRALARTCGGQEPETQGWEERGEGGERWRLLETIETTTTENCLVASPGILSYRVLGGGQGIIGLAFVLLAISPTSAICMEGCIRNPYLELNPNFGLPFQGQGAEFPQFRCQKN